MIPIDTTGIKAETKLFHNERIKVYPTILPLHKIHFWKENNRTIFTFEKLVAQTGKDISKLTTEEITEFIASQSIHKISTLAKSVERNGVQVPLIMRDDGKLLDGNRRFFACQWLKLQAESEGKPLPKALSEIPVQVIKAKDLDDILELKILAEANFITSLKVAWSLDAQARAVDEYYRQVRKDKKLDHESALNEVVAVFGIKRQRAIDLLDTLKLTKEFIAGGKTKEEKVTRRDIIENQFVYAWEFRNKATKGRGAIKTDSELEDVKELFFNFMSRGTDNPIKNVKQIEPIIQARRDRVAWNMLKESDGNKLNVVVSMMNDKREVRRAEDKVLIFYTWLTEADETEFSSRAKDMLKKVSKLAAEKAK